MNESKFSVPALLPKSKLIPLTQGQFAIVDECDYPWLMRWKWQLYRVNGVKNQYAQRTEYKNGKKTIKMHCQIMGFNGVDHCDRNGLNNTRRNMRQATNSQNAPNRSKDSKWTSKFKGVCWHSRVKKWHAQITWRRRVIHLGYFTDAALAAKVYDAKAVECFKEFACTNASLGIL